jgi:hypothetical protein
MIQIDDYIVFKQPAERVQLWDDYGHVCMLSLCLAKCVIFNGEIIIIPYDGMSGDVFPTVCVG